MNSTTRAPSNTSEVTWKPFLNPVTKAKIGMAVGLLVTVFIVTLIPVFAVRYVSKKWKLHPETNRLKLKTFKKWMSRINCFAAGVFLSTGFMDIFPEMMEAMEKAMELNKIKISFPLGPFLTLLGFFLILVIEESVLLIRKKITSRNVTVSANGVSDEAVRGEYDYAIFDNQADDVKGHAQEKHEHSIDHEHHDHHEHDLDVEALSKGNLTVTVLMIAISIHSIFEGLALGLLNDTAKASRLFLALCLHKYVIAVTIGLQISNSTLGMKMTILCSSIFSSATPIGVFFGFWVIYLEEIGDTNFSMVAAVLQAMACGTFFYIVFVEILPEEFGKKHDKWIKIFALLLGYGLVSVVMYAVHE